MKALEGAFNQEKVLVGAFSVIVKTDGSSAAHSTSSNEFSFKSPNLYVVIALTWGNLNCKTFYLYLFLTESIFYTLMVNQKFGRMFNCRYHRYYAYFITTLHNIFCKWGENDNISNCKLHIYLIDLIIIGFTSNIEHLPNCRILTLVQQSKVSTHFRGQNTMFKVGFLVRSSCWKCLLPFHT